MFPIVFKALFTEFLHLRMRKKDCYAYQNSSYLCCIITQKNCFITWNKLRNEFRIYHFLKKKENVSLWQNK